MKGKIIGFVLILSLVLLVAYLNGFFNCPCAELEERMVYSVPDDTNVSWDKISDSEYVGTFIIELPRDVVVKLEFVNYTKHSRYEVMAHDALLVCPKISDEYCYDLEEHSVYNLFGYKVLDTNLLLSWLGRSNPSVVSNAEGWQVMIWKAGINVVEVQT